MHHQPAECPGISFTGLEPRQGSAGTFVYQGVLNGKVVAVKQVPESNSKLVEREAEILSSLSHPNVVPISRRPHFHEAAGSRIGCLAMPWFEDTLEFYVDTPLNPNETFASLLIPLAEVLSYAHSRKKTHRDLKPSNILVSNEGAPIIADWGVAKDYLQSSSSTVGPWSSKGYTPTHPGDGYQLDVYCFGVIAVEVLAGQKSIQEFRRLELLESLKIEDSIKEILRKCLATDPENRFRRMVEVANELTKQHSLQGRSKMDRILEIQLNDFELSVAISKTLKCRIEEVRSKLDELLSSQKLFARNLDYRIEEADDLDLSEDQFTPDDFWLVGESFEVRVECTPLTGKILMLQFRETDYVQNLPLHKLPYFFWQVNNIGNPLQRENYSILRKSRESWDQAGSPDQSGRLKSDEEARLINEWSKTLDVLEFIKRGKGVGVKYWTEYEDEVGGFKGLRLEKNFEENLEGTNWANSLKPDLVLTILNHKDSHVVVRSIGKKISQLPSTGELIPTLDSGTKVALARKRDALNSLQEGKTANPKLGLILSSKFTEPKPRRLEVNHWYSNNFDESKRNAVRLALGAENIALIQGPPGTGKTEFITELINQTLSEKPSSTILLVSQTHVALDNALERLWKSSPSVKIARLGKSDNPSISSASQLWLPEQQLGAWAEQLEKNSTKFLVEFGMKIGLESHHAAGLMSLYRIQELYKMMRRQDSNSTSPIPRLEQDEIDLTKSLTTMLSKIRENFGNQLPEYDFPRNDAETSQIIDQIDVTIRVRGNYKKLFKAHANWITKLQSSNEVERLFLRSRSVLAGTCVGFLSNPQVREFEYDLCIIDEASRATSTEMLVPFCKSKKIILVGDTRQLGPSNIEFVNQDKLLLEHGLSMNQLNNNIFRTLHTRLPAHSITALNKQYRMVDPIGAMISSVFYEGKITSQGPSPLKSTLNPSNRLFTPIRWLDTSRLSDGYHKEPAPGVVHNNAEAQIVIDELTKLDKNLTEEHLGLEINLTVMVISPYRAQVSLIEGLLRDQKLSMIKPEILTIDSVQGREADIVFYSAVRSSDRPDKIGFLTPERFNVALSRARQSLTIIGNYEFWKIGNTKLSEVIHFINDLESSFAEKVALHDS